MTLLHFQLSLWFVTMIKDVVSRLPAPVAAKPPPARMDSQISESSRWKKPSHRSFSAMVSTVATRNQLMPSRVCDLPPALVSFISITLQWTFNALITNLSITLQWPISTLIANLSIISQWTCSTLIADLLSFSIQVFIKILIYIFRRYVQISL